MFSKVSRSLAQFTLVNSVSTLLNKGGITCNCPKASQDFFVNQNKQATAQLLCSSLVLSRHERSEGRRNSCGSSWPTQKHAKHAKAMSQTCQGSCRRLFRQKHLSISRKTDRGRKHIFTDRTCPVSLQHSKVQTFLSLSLGRFNPSTSHAHCGKTLVLCLGFSTHLALAGFNILFLITFFQVSKARKTFSLFLKKKPCTNSTFFVSVFRAL